MTLVERMARAMCDRVNGQGDYDENPARHAGWNAQARAVLAAAREPSRSVLVAGICKAEELEDYTQDSYANYRVDVASDAPLPIWQAMIDAALAEVAPEAEKA